MRRRLPALGSVPLGPSDPVDLLELVDPMDSLTP
jgi:hypothetical protein